MFIDCFLCIRVKIHTRSACCDMSVQKSFIIRLNVGSIPQMLKPKPNLSEGEASHEDVKNDCSKSNGSVESVKN